MLKWLEFVSYTLSIRTHKLEVWEKLIEFWCSTVSPCLTCVVSEVPRVIKCLPAEQNYLSSKTTNELSKNKSSPRLWFYLIISFTLRKDQNGYVRIFSPTISLNQLECHPILTEPLEEFPSKSPLGLAPWGCNIPFISFSIPLSIIVPFIHIHSHSTPTNLKITDVADHLLSGFLQNSESPLDELV